jgi:hypothetical protein
MATAPNKRKAPKRTPAPSAARVAAAKKWSADKTKIEKENARRLALHNKKKK